MSLFSLVCFVWKISSAKVQLSTNDIKRVWRCLGVFGLSITQNLVLKILTHISFFILYFCLHIPNDVFGSNISFRNSFFFFLVKWRFSNSLICISIYIYIYIGTLFTCIYIYWNSFHMTFLLEFRSGFISHVYIYWNSFHMTLSLEFGSGFIFELMCFLQNWI